MTEETQSEFTIVADLMPRIVEPSGSTFEVVRPLPSKVEFSNDGGKTWIDVDASWDGTGSLDEHRQKELAKLTQPGFGDAGKVKTNGE